MRSSQQKRKSPFHKARHDSLLLWLKFEENFADSSNRNVEIIEPSAPITLPSFSSSERVSPPASAFFQGTNSILIEGEEFLFFDRDFTIECDVKFDVMPDDTNGGTFYLWDWADIKLANHKGSFYIFTPKNEYASIDFFHPDLDLLSDFNSVAIVRKSGYLSLFLNGHRMIRSYAPDPLTKNSQRTIGMSSEQQGGFRGYIDNFRVFNEAIYNSEPVVIAPAVSVSHVLGEEEVWSPDYYFDQGQRDVRFRIDVSTTIDTRYSDIKPLPYYIKWFRNDSEITNDSIEKVSIDESINSLIIEKVHNGVGGDYSAEVHFPDRVFSGPDILPITLHVEDTYMIPIESKGRIEFKRGELSKVANIGDDISLSVVAYNIDRPLLFKWKQDGTEVFDGLSIEITDCGQDTSCIKFKDINKNYKNITCEVFSALGGSFETKEKGSVIVEEGKVLAPEILRVFPNEPSPTYTMGTELALDFQSTVNEYSIYIIEYSTIPGAANNYDIPVSVIASDPNLESSNTGGLKFQWMESDEWVDGNYQKNIHFYSGELMGRTEKCRISYVNYPEIYIDLHIFVNKECDFLDVENKKEDELIIYTGTVGQEFEFSSKGNAMTITSANQSYDESLEGGLGGNYTLKFKQDFWVTNNDSSGGQDLRVSFADPCGSRNLDVKINVIKSSPIKFEKKILGGGGEETLVFELDYDGEVKTKHKVLHDVILHGKSEENYFNIFKNNIALLSSPKRIDGSSLDLDPFFVEFGPSLSHGTAREVRLNIIYKPSHLQDGDTFRMEFYNNLPSPGNFSNADTSETKKYTIFARKKPEITSVVFNDPSKWKITAHKDNGKTIFEAFSHEEAKAYTMKDKYVKPIYPYRNFRRVSLRGIH